MKILIRGGRVVDPGRELDAPRDVLIEDGRIVDLVDPGQGDGWVGSGEVIRADGLIVAPGLIDMHVHLREPGQEYKEDIETGTRAAAAGGFTAIAAMANTSPVNDTRSVTEFILGRAREKGSARVWPVAAMTLGLAGEKLCQYGELADAGAVAVSDDGRWVRDGRVMRRVLEYSRAFGLAAISHAEDPDLSDGGVMNEGLAATRMGLAGIPNAAEDVAVARDVHLVELTRAPLHIAHVSTAGAVEIIRRAKEAGLPVTAETAPHYFSLTEEAVVGYRTEAKMNPPLRTEADRIAIVQALAQGVIDVIASDHAPHSSIEKDTVFDQAAFGIIGLETSLALTLELVRQGALTLNRAIAALTERPAGILNQEAGTLQSGRPADLTVIDPDREWTADPELMRSKSRNTPFAGRNLKGRAVLTLVQGQITHDLMDTRAGKGEGR